MRRTRTYLVLPAVVIALLIGVTGCAGSAYRESGDQSTDPASAATEGSSAVFPGAEPLHGSTTKVDDVVKGVITTDKGVIEVTFRPDKAPNTVASFVELAESGFYDGTKIHRVEPGFVIQGGDPQTKDPNVNPQLYGTGGPGWRQKAEFNDLKHDRGVLAMARSSDPDSAGSQFYITLGAANFLDGSYTVFGKVVSGMEVVDRIAVGDVVTSVEIVRGK